MCSGGEAYAGFGNFVKAAPAGRHTPRMKFARVLVAATLIGGCYQPIEYPPTPTPDPAPSPSPASLLVTGIELVTDEPVLEGSDLEAGDHFGATLSAAYFIDAGVHHLYVVGFGDAPGDQRVFHASSPDGSTWAVDEADPFAELGLEMSPPGPIPGSVLEIGGQWVMYLWGVPSPLREGAQIYRAVAPGPGGPWVADPAPVLPLGGRGEVDDRGLDFPSVVATADGYLMLYSANGGDRPNAGRILAARSADGIAWQKLGRVIEPADCGGPDSSYNSIPRLFGSGYGFVVLTVLGNDIATLTSIDALNWTCVGDGPMFRATEVAGSDRVHSMAAAFDGTRLSVLIEAIQYDEQGSIYTNLWMADSTP